MKTPFDWQIEYCLRVAQTCNKAMADLQSKKRFHGLVSLVLIALMVLVFCKSWQSGYWLACTISAIAGAVAADIGMSIQASFHDQIEAAQESRSHHLYCADQFKVRRRVWNEKKKDFE